MEPTRATTPAKMNSHSLTSASDTPPSVEGVSSPPEGSSPEKYSSI